MQITNNQTNDELVRVANEWNGSGGRSENVQRGDQQASCYMPLAPVVMQSKRSDIRYICINATPPLTFAHVTVCIFVCTYVQLFVACSQGVMQRSSGTKINQKKILQQKFATKLILATTLVASEYCCKWQQWNQCGSATLCTHVATQRTHIHGTITYLYVFISVFTCGMLHVDECLVAAVWLCWQMSLCLCKSWKRALPAILRLEAVKAFHFDSYSLLINIHMYISIYMYMRM